MLHVEIGLELASAGTAVWSQRGLTRAILDVVVS